MTSVWILFVVIYSYNPYAGNGPFPAMVTQTFKSQESCEAAKKAVLQSLVLPSGNEAKAVCVEDKGPKSL